MTKNQRGVAPIFAILLIVLMAGAAAYWYFMFYLPGLKNNASPTATETKLIKKTENTQESTDASFKQIPEDENTPGEIDNTSLDEMDQIILSVDGSEDLSDLQ